MCGSKVQKKKRKLPIVDVPLTASYTQAVPAPLHTTYSPPTAPSSLNPTSCSTPVSPSPKRKTSSAQGSLTPWPLAGYGFRIRICSAGWRGAWRWMWRLSRGRWVGGRVSIRGGGIRIIRFGRRRERVYRVGVRRVVDFWIPRMRRFRGGRGRILL